MSFNFKEAMLKASKDLKVFIDNYLEEMDYKFMAEISKKQIHSISESEFLRLGILKSSYHKITYIPKEKWYDMGFESNPNDELELNPEANFFVFKKLPFVISDFILEFYNNTCILTKGDKIEKVEITTGKQLISEIFEHLNIKTYKTDLNRVIYELQQELFDD